MQDSSLQCNIFNQTIKQADFGTRKSSFTEHRRNKIIGNHEREGSTLPDKPADCALSKPALKTITRRKMSEIVANLGFRYLFGRVEEY